MHDIELDSFPAYKMNEFTYCITELAKKTESEQVKPFSPVG